MKLKSGIFFTLFLILLPLTAAQTTDGLDFRTDDEIDFYSSIDLNEKEIGGLNYQLFNNQNSDFMRILGAGGDSHTIRYDDRSLHFYNPNAGSVLNLTRSGNVQTFGNINFQSNDLIAPNLIRTDGTGSDVVIVRDSSQYNDIARFYEGGNVSIMSGRLGLSGNRITNLGVPQEDSDAVRLGYLSDNYLNTSGDTYRGNLDMNSNRIINVGAGNVELGDGAGDLNINGQQVYGSSLSQNNFLGVTTLTTAQTEKANMGDYSAYIQNDLKVGGDIIGSGGDVAENVKNQSKMEEGTVAKIAGKFEVEPSTEKRDTAVAGVVSTNPGVNLKKERDGVPLALTGIVPVKATVENGEINPGDLLTTSSREGYAMKCQEKLNCQGAIIGKSMGSLSKTGKVQILVTLG